MGNMSKQPLGIFQRILETNHAKQHQGHGDDRKVPPEPVTGKQGPEAFRPYRARQILVAQHHDKAHRQNRENQACQTDFPSQGRLDFRHQGLSLQTHGIRLHPARESVKHKACYQKQRQTGNPRQQAGIIKGNQSEPTGHQQGEKHNGQIGHRQEKIGCI